MKLLLEFKDYNDLSFVKDTVDDVILSEIEESINPVVHQSIITISDREITCHDLKRSEYNNSELDFISYLVSFNGRIEKDQFDSISPRIESILSLEFDDKVKCITLQSFPINEFVICNESDYQILQSVCKFEYSIEDEIYNIKDNSYTSVVDLTTDQNENYEGVTIWIRKYLSKLGINLSLIREKIESNCLNYTISTEFFFNSSRQLNGRWIQTLNLNKPDGQYKTDVNVTTWMRDNLPIHYDTLNNLKKIGEKIESMNLKFELDLNEDPNIEAERFLRMIIEKVLPIFETQETKRISKLYDQFKRLKEYNIDAEWQHQGNYFYLFDINYRGEHYIINIKYDIKKDLIKIHMLHPSDLSDEIKIEDFCDTIYLLLEEN